MKKPKRLTFAKLEAQAKKRGLKVFQVLDEIVFQLTSKTPTYGKP